MGKFKFYEDNKMDEITKKWINGIGGNINEGWQTDVLKLPQTIKEKTDKLKKLKEEINDEIWGYYKYINNYLNDYPKGTPGHDIHEIIENNFKSLIMGMEKLSKSLKNIKIVE